MKRDEALKEAIKIVLTYVEKNGLHHRSNNLIQIMKWIDLVSDELQCYSKKGKMSFTGELDDIQ